MVCIFGTFFNFLNIIVVGHKDMRSNPINLILGAIAVADILLMLEYIPYSVHMYIMETEQYNRTREEKVGSTGAQISAKNVNFVKVCINFVDEDNRVFWSPTEHHNLNSRRMS